ESQPELAGIINGDAPRLLAELSLEHEFDLVHISTDFVFNGKKSSPYEIDDPTGPLSEYGRSKLLGEEAVLELLGEDAAVIRTAWVYDVDRSNFVRTMLRLMRERESLRVVADQIGTPTWSHTAAEAIIAVVEQELGGIFHVTDAGVASWYDFAVAIQEEAFALDLLDKMIPIHPIRTIDYPTPATRPAYSVLDKTDTWDDLGITPRHWRVSLRLMLDQLAAAG